MFLRIFVSFLLCYTLVDARCSYHDILLFCEDTTLTEVFLQYNGEQVVELNNVTGPADWTVEKMSSVITLQAQNVNLDCSDLFKLSNLTRLSALTVDGGTIRCDRNEVFKFDNPTLRRLKLNHISNTFTRLRTVNFKFTYLEDLDLSHNDLTRFPTINGDDIVFLNLSSNEDLTDIGSLKGVPSLEELDMSFNNILEINRHTFEDVINIEKLWIKHNNINSVYLVAPFLKLVDLSQNNLVFLHKDIFVGAPELKTLWLHDCNIIDLEKPFDMLKDLRNLDLSTNDIEIFAKDLFINNKMLEILKLDHSGIEALQVTPLPNLHFLNLSSNNLGDLNPEFFKQTPNLAILDISHNELTDLNGIGHLNKLNKLMAGSNFIDITEDTFSHMEALNSLDLSNNELDIPLDVFSSNLQLRDINLSNNQITSLCLNDKAPSQILNLNLRNNKISSIDCLERVTSIDISNNSLTCGRNYLDCPFCLHLKQILRLGAGLSKSPISDYSMGVPVINSESNYRDICGETFKAHVDDADITDVTTQVSPAEVSTPLSTSTSSVSNFKKIAEPKWDDPMYNTYEEDGESEEDEEDDEEDDDDDEEDDEEDDDDDEEDDHNEVDDKRDQMKDVSYLEAITRARGLSQDNYRFWIYAAMGFILLCFLLIVTMVTLCVLWRLKQRRMSGLDRAYEQLDNRVYKNTTMKQPASNINRSICRPVVNIFKNDSKLGDVLMRLGIRPVAQDPESTDHMIPPANVLNV